MSQTVLDQAFTVAEANGVARYRVVVAGSGQGTCEYPTSPFNQNPLGVTTHSQNIVGKPVGVRSFGVIKCEVTEAISTGEPVIVADATGRIKQAPKANKIIGASPTTNQILFTALQTGFSGNNIEIEFEPLGQGDPMDVSLIASKLLVGCETSDDETIISTAQEVIDAVNAHPEASLLLGAENVSTSNGSGVVFATTETLEGGTAGNYAIGIARESATAAGDLIEILIK